MAVRKIEEARVRQKADTLEKWQENNLPLLDGEQAFIRSDVDNETIGFKLGVEGKKFSELPYPDFTVKGKVSPSSTWVGRQSGIYIPTLNGTYNGIEVNLTEGYQVLYWDGATIEKVVYPIDFTGIVFGGVIDSSADLSSPTTPIWYIASAGTYNTVPPTILGETSILTWNGTEWSHIPFDLEVRGEFLVADNIAEIRSMPAPVIDLLVNGTYKGVTLLGYHEDKPKYDRSINYYLSDTTAVDDGGSVIEVSGIKLEHNFDNGADACYYGAIENEDSTIPINTALLKNREVIISKNYKVNPVKAITGTSFGGGIILNNDNVLRFINGAKLYIDTQTSDKYVIVNLRNTSNATVIDGYVEGDIETHEGEVGEYGFGYYIASAYNPVLINCKAYKCWGDGIVVTSDNVTQTAPLLGRIDNPFLSNNRRQGLSIIAWDCGVVNGGVYEYTGGIKSINPSFGIDVEPNADGRSVINVVINNPTTRFNKNGGILINPAQMTDESYDNKAIFNLTINNHLSYNDLGFAGLRLNYSGDSTSWNPLYTTSKINGNININNPTIQNSASNSIRFDRWGKSAPDVNITDITIIDPNRNNHTDRALGSPIVVIPSQVQDDIGSINVSNIEILETEDNRVYCGVNVIMYAFSAKNIIIKNIKVSNLKDPSQAKVYYNKSEDLYVYYDKKPKNIITGNAPIGNNGRYNGEILSINSGTVTLPSLSVSGGYEIEFEYGNLATSAVFISPNGADLIDMVGFNSGDLIQMGSNRDRIVLKNINNKWRVISFQGVVRPNSRASTDLNNSYISSAGAPTVAPKSQGEFYFDSVSRIWYKSINTIAVNNYVALNPIATTTVRGDVLMVAASADTATQASGATPTKAEFDALLAELRDLKTKMRAGSAPILAPNTP